MTRWTCWRHVLVPIDGGTGTTGTGSVHRIPMQQAVALAAAEREVVAAELQLSSEQHASMLQRSLAAGSVITKVAEAKCLHHLEARVENLLTSIQQLQQHRPKPAVDVTWLRSALVAERGERARASSHIERIMREDIASMQKAIALEREARRASDEALNQLLHQLTDTVRTALADERRDREGVERSVLTRLQQFTIAATISHPQTPLARQSEVTAWRVDAPDRWHAYGDTDRRRTRRRSR